MLAQEFHQAKALEHLQRCGEQKLQDQEVPQLLLVNLNGNVVLKDHVV
jgi:hypothetical protein